MSGIGEIRKLTDKPFLNFYELDAIRRDGRTFPYYLASRAKDIPNLKAVSRQNPADGVILCAVYGEEMDRLVLIRQYRYALGDYIYEFPAGLVEPGENLMAAATRELYEETGLHLDPQCATRPFFTTIGLTDESCATVFGRCEGVPTNAHQEAAEDIQVILADRQECRRILQEEHVSLMCGYMMLHFLSVTGDPWVAFAQEEQKG